MARYLNYDHPHTPIPGGRCDAHQVREGREGRRSFSLDPQMLLFTMVALIVISALLLVLGIGGAPPFDPLDGVSLVPAAVPRDQH